MKRILVLLLVLTAAFGTRAQLLWQISGNGLKQPSYVFGTHHYAPLSVLDSVPQVRTALQQVTQVCGEINMLDLGKATRMMAEAMMLPKDKTLSDFIPERSRGAVDAMMKQYLGVGIDNPAMQRICPVAIETQLVAAIVAKKLPKIAGDSQLDLYFQSKADKAGKKIAAFETMQQQLDLLFSKSLYRQGKLLACVAENADWSVGYTEMLTEAYMLRDLNSIEDAINMKLESDCDSTPEEEAALYSDRNAQWLKTMPAMMQSDATLFVVGVAHLVGDQGLLRSLRAAGYTVEPVDKVAVNYSLAIENK